MKPKIALLMGTLDSGGIEKAAVTLLRTLPIDKYDIHLILNVKKGIYLKQVPSYITVHELGLSSKYQQRLKLGDKRFLFQSLKKFDLKSILDLIKTGYYTIFKTNEQKQLYKIAQLSRAIKFPDIEFDLIFAYSNLDQLYHAVKVYKTRKIFAWLHTEIDCKREDIRYYRSLYEKCDRIFGVSNKVVQSFQLLFPELQKKLSLNKNIIDVNLIKELSNEYEVSRPNKEWWFLTVGRLQLQKGIDIIPDIAIRLKKAGINFKWSIIGEGPLKVLLKEKIIGNELEKEIEILGEKENPYPYFKLCDVYLQPSRYEGYCLTVAEARIFRKPIVATDFAGSREQLEGGKCGKIVEFGIDSFTTGILEIICDVNLREQYEKNLSIQKIDTTDSISELIDNISISLQNN